MIKIKIDKEQIKYLVNEKFEINAGDENITGNIRLTKEQYEDFAKIENGTNIDEIGNIINTVLNFDSEVDFNVVQKINIFSQLMENYSKTKGKHLTKK